VGVSKIAEASSVGLERGELKIANAENHEIYRVELFEFWVLLKKCEREAQA
jgi:hypothetical protein